MNIHDYALTSLADVKETLDIANGITKYDNQIIRLINKSTDMIEKYCNGRRFKSTTHTEEKLNGDGSGTAYVKHYPIISITGIQYLTSNWENDNWDDLDGSFYTFQDKSGIIKSNTSFGRGVNNWRVTYVGGYAVIPSDLAEACVDLAVFMFNKAKSTGVKSERLGDRSIEWFAPTNSSIIKELGLDEILDLYRMPVF